MNSVGCSIPQYQIPRVGAVKRAKVMAVPVITADFNNADVQGRLRLSIIGAIRDFARLGLRLQDGLRITVCDNEGLEADGEVVYSADEHIWVAKIDWNAIRHLPAPATTELA